MILIDYLYYTLYLFYTKIIKLQNFGDDSHFNCSAVLAFLGMISVWTFSNVIMFFGGRDEYDFLSNKYIYIFFSLSLLGFNYYYLRGRREQLLPIYSKKSKRVKWRIVIISVVIMISLVFLWLYTGYLIRKTV